MTGLMWIGVAAVAALLARPFLEQLAVRLWPPDWEHCDHCATADVMHDAVRDGVLDVLGKLDDLSTIATGVDEIRAAVAEQRQSSQVS